MKNLSKVLALVLVVAMVFSFAVSASAKTSFKDDASIKYEEAVELLSALKVINGYTDGTFKPTGSITRGEFAVMVSYMVANNWSETPLYSDIKQLGKDYAPYCTFADTKNHWSAGYVAYCAGNGYISGRSADVFDPDATITAAEISVILLRVMGYDATIENFGTTSGTTKGYATQLTARNAGLLEGLDTMNFWAAATREQAAQLMFNALKGNVVTYGNVTFTLDLQGRVVVSNLNNTKAVQSSRDLMSYCFRRVTAIEATDINGFTGHQWVAYSNVGVTADGLVFAGNYTKLTDVYKDENIIATYKGGTAYSKIATDLGITSRTTNKTAVVYVNGAEYDGSKAAIVDLPGSLIDIYANGTKGEALPDNCRLEVVKNPDRSVAGTTYKLLYYYELVGVVSDISKITNRMDPHYGDYMYTFTYWYDYPYATTNMKNGYVFSASDKAYSDEVFYLVEPNDSGILQPSANSSVVEDYQDFLSIKQAAVEGPVMLTSGTYATFSKNVGHAASDGSKNYKISLYAHDFVNEAGYNKNMYLIYNTAGYVQGFLPAKTASNVESTGYVYIDSLEYEVTATSGSNLIKKADATISAQAKALGYFPTAAGNSTPTVMDLAINARTWRVAAAKANNGYTAADPAVQDAYIQLPTMTTTAYYDVGNIWYYFNQPGNVRVFDLTFDGWYYYEKLKDGSYTLAPVGTAEVNTVKGDANTDLVLDGNKYVLTSSTADNIYNMDLGTMTASVATITGYKNILTGLHGGCYPDTDPVYGATYVPYIGRVGCEIAVNERNLTIAIIDEFNISTPANALRYALYKGTSGYYTAEGQYRMKFLGAGVANYLFAAEEVNFDGTAIAGTELYKELKNDGSVCYALTLDNDNYIVAIKSIALNKGTANGTDVDGYIRIDQVAYNFDMTQIWNFVNGKAETIANGDTIYYADVDGDGDIDILWLTHAGAAPVSDPRWTTPGSTGVTPWVWWIH